MECFIHAGFHKTGTTSLQALLEANRARLGTGAGLINHGSAPMRRIQNACARFEKRRDRASGERIAAEMRAALKTLNDAGVSRAILSSEAMAGPIPAPHRKGRFYETAPEILFWVREGTGAHETHFCLYLREHEGWCESLHAHLLRSRGIKGGYAAFRDCPGLRDFSLERTAEEIAARIGKVALFRMEDDFGDPLGPGAAFLRLAGFGEAELRGWTVTPPQNTGLRKETVAFMSRPIMTALPKLLRRRIAERLDRRFRKRSRQDS